METIISFYLDQAIRFIRRTERRLISINLSSRRFMPCNRWIKLATLLILPLMTFSAHGTEPKILNIYTWFDVIPRSVVEQFEKETGIQVVMDYYDTNQTLESQLLTRSTGYDLAFPTAWPFMARQLQKGLLRPLDKSKLPNLSNLDEDILKALETVDPGNLYAIPFFWGVTGIGYNKQDVKKLLPNADLESWSLIFDPENAKKLSQCGIYILDDASDVFSSALVYLGFPPNSTDEKHLQKAFDLLMSIRPYIRRFDTYRAMSDLANGEACAAQNWSGDVAVARDRALEAKNGVDIGFVIPKEGTALWIDTVVIPSDARHPDNAHLFLNFIMRPEIIAEITNEMLFANANKASYPLIDEEVKNNPIVYPGKEVLKKSYISSSHSVQHQRLLNRFMMKLKLRRE